MIVHVYNHKKELINPISPVKAKLLLMDGKAKVIKKIPYTILLLEELDENQATKHDAKLDTKTDTAQKDS